MDNYSFNKKRLSRAVSLASIPVMGLSALSSYAQEAGYGLEEITVTSSRRETSVQDIPINITAVSDTMIEDLRLTNISEIARYVPGLTVIDRGPRDEIPDILIRGLNTSGLGPGFTSDTVATYIGDIPLDVDFNPVDIERVEVLKGPQGTLYGQGTMAGAIRYIPKRADATEFTADVRGELSSQDESDGIATDVGITVNVPLIQDVLAIRANLDMLKEPGFIDYNFVVREAGVSDPEPDFSNPDEVAANLRQVEDANGQDLTSGRLNLRWTPNDWLDANLWYFYQKTEAEGRQQANQLSFGTGPYESAARYEEPSTFSNELISLEVKADVGFADLTFVYGDSQYDELGQRDQTDLLLGFEYGYEAFPTFSAFTRETDDQTSETIELRLVSTNEGPFQWAVGYFDNEFTQDAVSEEFTPGFDQFAVDNFGGVQLRPDSLEYIQLTDVDEKETAFYGEISYDLTEALTLTFGYRDYEFEVDNTGGFGLPLFETVFNGAPQDVIDSTINLGTNSGEDSGDLIKINAAYDFDEDNMMYFTYSEGYRNGGVNSVPECTPEQLASPNQQLCAQADEVFIDPDTIENYEIGYKGILLDNTLSINAAIYYIDWQNLQVDTVTDLGNLPITGNGSEAESKGFEFQSSYYINEKWNLDVTYAFTNAELTALAPGLVASFDALAGARLPGHAEHQGSINLRYSTVVWDDVEMDVAYGITYSSDIYNGVGGPDDPLVDPANNNAPADRGLEALPSYSLHSLSATFARNQWRAQVFIDNLWDEYYVTGTRTSRRSSILQDEQNGPGVVRNGFTDRSYAQFVGDPRNIGVRVSYEF